MTEKHLTEADLAEIEARANAATSGPWRRDSFPEGSGCKFVISDRDFMVADVPHRPNTEFIAHARQDVPALLAEVRYLRAAMTDASWRVEETGMAIIKTALNGTWSPE